ncbi:hypothetical protein GCM10011360_21230 [Primorskyibacter flagellatus]|uniref:Uncharacterized protein n=1 Tax=Primorskyibacter flagellatus TaxID=1387277 RepID=A0A917EER7_9RHOB|nr:hypothetical protein [Primorskyibacter flagellatus]GGE33126.1 hypothetical protein GCM10011360_21230 [Primorskyibacter flagellatus]
MKYIRSMVAALALAFAATSAAAAPVTYNWTATLTSVTTSASGMLVGDMISGYVTLDSDLGKAAPTSNWQRYNAPAILDFYVSSLGTIAISGESFASTYDNYVYYSYPYTSRQDGMFVRANPDSNVSTFVQINVLNNAGDTTVTDTLEFGEPFNLAAANSAKVFFRLSGEYAEANVTTFELSAIPLPATGLALLGALGGFAAFRRRS